MKFLRNFLKKTEGVAATEFGLIAPLFIALMVGTYDTGMYISQKNKLENLSRAAAEYVMLGGLPENVETDLIDVVQSSDFGLNNVSVVKSRLVCTCSDGISAECGDSEICGEDDYLRTYVEIELTHEFTPISPVFFSTNGSTTTRASARMRVN